MRPYRWFIHYIAVICVTALLILSRVTLPAVPTPLALNAALSPCAAQPRELPPRAARAWHRFTPPFAAAWQERLEREEDAVAADVEAARLSGFYVQSPTNFDVTRTYLLHQLKGWVARHNITSSLPMGTYFDDAEWLLLPHNASSLLVCPFAGEGTQYGLDEEPCDLHNMAVPGALGARDLFSWAQTMEHLVDPELGLARVASHLAPRGWHVVSTPTHNLPHGEPWHFFHTTPAGLALLSQRVGLVPVEVGYFGWVMCAWGAASGAHTLAAHALPHTLTHTPARAAADVADSYAMAFAQKSQRNGNNENERFWMGRDAASRVWGGVQTKLRAASQALLLSRREGGGCGNAAEELPPAAFSAFGAATVATYAAARPPVPPAPVVVALYRQWVKARWGWAPRSEDLAAVREALGEAEDAREMEVAREARANKASAYKAGMGSGAGVKSPLLAACGGAAREAGNYIALAGLFEALRAALDGGSAPPPAGGGALTLEDVEGGGACLCAIAARGLRVAFDNGGEACSAYGGGLPGGTLTGAQLGGGGPPASLLLLEDFLEYVEDPLLALLEAKSALLPGGWLWVSARVVAPYNPYANGRVLLRTLTPTALLVTLTRAGFDVLWAQHWGVPGHVTLLVTRDAGPGVAFATLEQGKVPASEWVSASVSWVLARRPI
jgi:hypothetical protein